ncbi:MAG: hypothetical protein MI862_21225 [Desulfobacterales bacterium]|nr:hypothetical protein [Desulfobacterales bacterium]
MIQVSINIPEAERIKTDNSLSCQIYDATGGGHLFGFDWHGGNDENGIMSSPSVTVDPFPETVYDVDVTVQNTRQFEYEIIVDYE